MKRDYSSDSVRIRSVRQEDSSLLFEWINNHELVVLNAPYRPISTAEHEQWFESLKTRKNLAFFMIEDIDSGLAIGSCQLTNIHNLNKSAELQIRIGRSDFQNQGAGSETVRLLTRYGFDKLKLHRIMLQVFSTNLRAIRVYKKNGFQQEGVLRDAAFIDGCWINVFVFGLINPSYS